MGHESSKMAFYRYVDHLAAPMVFQSAQHAQEEGFDAVIINCFGDPMLHELRQALDIPVIGIGEPTFLLSSVMCAKAQTYLL
jgi:allantoin racemase